jgi:UDPglucose 6-dehydrogenase
MFERRIAVIGTGYVGLTTGACLAALGHTVLCADVDAAKMERLRAGTVDILEPGLPDLVAEGIASGRLGFVPDAVSAVRGCPGDGAEDRGPAEVVFLCLPTPMDPSGRADLRALHSVVRQIRRELSAGSVLVTKSTVPVGTVASVRILLGRDDVPVVSNPEFLREGSAVRDFMHPDRIVVGCDTPYGAERVSALYARFGAPTVLTDAASAEMVKYAANCFLAMKLSYVNALAELCEHLGANIGDVTEGIGYDHRIGQAYLRPGPGWGGSCLPKDALALLRMAESADCTFDLLRATIATNDRQKERIVDKIRFAVTGSRSGSLDGVKLGLLGLTFKAGTGDLRESPALGVAALLRRAGAELVGYDPTVPVPPVDATPPRLADVRVVDDPAQVAPGARALVLLTEWPEFRTLDWAGLARAVSERTVVDTRNMLDVDVLRRAGFTVHSLGRR